MNSKQNDGCEVLVYKIGYHLQQGLWPMELLNNPGNVPLDKIDTDEHRLV